MYFLDEKKFSRRALLHRIGGTAAYAALFPLLPILDADAAPGGRKRYISWFTNTMPDHIITNPNLPNRGMGGGELKFGAEFTPLNAKKNKIAFIGDVSNPASEKSAHQSHTGGWTTMLTGSWNPGKGKGGGDFLGKHIELRRTTTSLDMLLSDDLVKRGIRTPIKDVIVGNNNNLGRPIFGTYSFRNGKYLTPIYQPKAVYDRMFKLAPKARVGGPPRVAANPAEQANNQSGEHPYETVLDYSKHALNRLRHKISREDLYRLEAHLQTISEIENELSFTVASIEAPAEAMKSKGGGGGKCSIPNLGRQGKVEAYTKLIGAAFNCDLTRVASFVMMDNGFHNATHSKGGGPLIKRALATRARNFVAILNELEKYPDPQGGSILDHSVVHWWSELPRNHSNKHNWNIIGGGAGHIKTGVSTNLKAPQNRVLTSIAHAMGSQFETVGDKQFGTGGLPQSALV